MVKDTKIRVFVDNQWRLLDENNNIIENMNHLHTYNTKKAQCLVFIMGMQDAMEEYFGKVSPSFRKLVKWNTADKLMNDYLTKSKRLFWHMNVTRPEISKLNDKLSGSHLDRLLKKSCIADDTDFNICNLVDIIKNAKGNIVIHAFESMRYWLDCIDKNGYEHAMISLGLMKDKSDNIKMETPFEIPDYKIKDNNVSEPLKKRERTYSESRKFIEGALPELTERLNKMKKEAELGPYHDLINQYGRKKRFNKT